MTNIILDYKVLKLFLKILIEQVLPTGVWDSHPAAHIALATTLPALAGALSPERGNSLTDNEK